MCGGGENGEADADECFPLFLALRSWTGDAGISGGWACDTDEPCNEFEGLALSDTGLNIGEDPEGKGNYK